MCPEPDDLNMLIRQYRTMNIEELKENIDHLEKDTEYSHRSYIIDIAKNELELKYQERQEQIKLLTKSLTSSSRIGRWFSSAKALVKQILEFDSY